MDRKLASVQFIDNLTPIDGADRIECAKVLGWTTVVKKGEFSIGDKCVFFEIDSLFDVQPWNTFLSNKDDNTKPIRLKTIKLRKQISQGLALPLSTFPSIDKNIEVGTDVTELLNVRKWEPTISTQLTGVAKGNFPHFCRKSDESRLQSLRSTIFDEFDGKLCVITEKANGSSGTFFHKDGEVGACSRNLLLKEPDIITEGNRQSVYWTVEKQYDILNKLKNYGRNIQLIGEVVGAGIQGNDLNINGLKWLVFTGFNIDTQEYIGYDELSKICRDLDFEKVKTITDLFIFDKKIHTLEFFLNMSKGLYEGTQNNREGLVIRTIQNIYSETLKDRLSVKVINNDFLLGKGE